MSIESPASPSSGSHDASTATPLAGGGADGLTSSQTPAPAAPSLSKPEPGEGGIAHAIRKAKEAKASAAPNAGTQESATAEQAGQADSTRTSTQAPKDGAATSGKDQPSASTAATPAPEHWSPQDRQEFESLPEAGRQVLLRLNKSREAGHTKAMQKLGDDARLGEEYRGLQQRAEQDPKSFLRDLASQLGQEVRFADDPPPEEPPEFASPAELAKWSADQAAQRLRAEIQALQQEEARRQAEERTRTEFRQEWQTAQTELPDFGEHQVAVLNLLRSNPGLEVKQAYRLAKFGGMEKALGELNREVAELRKVKADAEQRAKRLTAPVRGSGNGAVDAKKMPGLSATEQAILQARQNRAAH